MAWQMAKWAKFDIHPVTSRLCSRSGANGRQLGRLGFGPLVPRLGTSAPRSKSGFGTTQNGSMLHTLRTRFGVATRAPRHEYRGDPGKCVTPGCRSLRLGVNSRGGRRPSGPYRSWTRATALGTAWRLGGCGCAVRALLAVNHEAETFEVMSSLSVAGGARAVVLLRGDRCTAALSAPATGHDVKPKSPQLKFQWRSCSLADVEYRGRSVHMPPVPCTDSTQD